MYSLKDKVSDKLSYLFSDSPSPPHQPRTRQHNKEGRSLASIFSYILPSAISNGSQSNHQQHVIKPIQSHPVRWKDKSFSRKDIPLQNYVMGQTFDDEEVFGTPKETEDQGSGRSTSGSDTFEDVTDSRCYEKSMSKLIHESFFISTYLYEFFQSSLPNIVKGCEWVLLYSTAKHGISLRTLIRKSADLSGPILLIAGDMQGAVFGGMLEAPLKPTAKRKYQGTNQTFVFTTIYGEPRLFRPTGANRFFYLCLNDMLALGGGGNFALRLDGDLLSGTSGPCDTFGNLCLAYNQEFELKNVELWGFTHSSKYLL